MAKKQASVNGGHMITMGRLELQGADGLFNLDGVLVPYPGHPDLPV
jgi:hypothetical protein